MSVSNEPSETSDRFSVRTTADTHFSWLRTRLAIERTMMAYMRTAVSLIGFGFAIVKFFEGLDSLGRASPAHFPEAPRYLGLALIFSGVATMIISLWLFRWMIRYLWSDPFKNVAGINAEGTSTPLYAVSIFLALTGLFAFFAVLLRLV